MQTIRAATPGDLEAIALMHARSWHHGFHDFIAAGLLPDAEVSDRRAFWATRIPQQPTGLVLVAEDSTGITGACAIDMPSEVNGFSDSTGAEVEALYVDPIAWRTGTGRALLAYARPILRTRGHHSWALWTLSTRAALSTVF
jgi:GNAT superfamily N-acetyltransferase